MSNNYPLEDYREEVKVGDFRIAFERKGKGQPLLLLHGALGDSRAWRKQIDDLSDEYEVVAWDAPGCGRSSDPPETFSISAFADSLAAFMKAIGLDTPHVLGLSFGGGLALEYYNRYPDDTRSLILAGAYAGWAGSLPREEVDQRLQRVDALTKMPIEQIAEELVPTFFSETVSRDVVEEITAIMADFHPIGLKAMTSALGNADLNHILPEIKVPTLLLYGDKDKRSPQYVAEKMHSSIPGSKLVIMPGVGHASNLEAPDIFNKEVRNFLRELK